MSADVPETIACCPHCDSAEICNVAGNNLAEETESGAACKDCGRRFETPASRRPAAKGGSRGPTRGLARDLWRADSDAVGGGDR